MAQATAQNLVLEKVDIDHTAVDLSKPLWESAWASPKDDLEILHVLYALDYATCNAIGAYNRNHSSELRIIAAPFAFRMKPVEKALAGDDLPKSLRIVFSQATLHYNELSALNDCLGHGFAHHFNFSRNDNGVWTALNVRGLMAPEAFHMMPALFNPYHPEQYPDPRAEKMVLDADRFRSRIDVIADISTTDRRDVARLAFVYAVGVAARRVDGTPAGQVGLDMYLKLAKMADDVADIGLNPDFYQPPKP